MLKDYKDQQDVERGFRFLKDPWFMVDSIFLKSEKRISALMMVMTLCLMVYNIAQYKLRNTLKANAQTLPNQLGKQIQNPTLRWVFQLMEGIAVVLFYGKGGTQPIREVVTNLDATRLKIIRLCGRSACNIYGIIENSTEKIVGM
jgi:transposase